MKQNGKRFVSLLKAAGWSQAEVARQLRISPGAVSQICRGKTQPRPVTLNLLELIVTRPLAKSRIAPTDSMASERQLLEELRRLPRAQRESLLSVFRQLIRTIPRRSKR